jgi:hypothetical protein
MLPRCSTHNLGKLVDYSADSINLYPDGPPTHDVEVLIHKLNLQAFPSSSYARVDDILVYALFATKKRPHYYRALLPATASDHRDITDEEALSISNIVRKEVSHDNPSREECELAAFEISCRHHQLLLEEDLPIVEQYVIIWAY